MGNPSLAIFDTGAITSAQGNLYKTRHIYIYIYIYIYTIEYIDMWMDSIKVSIISDEWHHTIPISTWSVWSKMYYQKRNQIVCRLLSLGSTQHTVLGSNRDIHFCYWRNSTWLFEVYQKTQSLWLLINLDRSNCQTIVKQIIFHPKCLNYIFLCPNNQHHPILQPEKFQDFLWNQPTSGLA